MFDVERIWTSNQYLNFVVGVLVKEFWNNGVLERRCVRMGGFQNGQACPHGSATLNN